MAHKRVPRWTLRLSRRLRFGKRYHSRRFARHYDRGKQFEGVRGDLLRTLERVLPLDQAVVVDVGCGTGQLADRLAGPVSTYHGFDNAPAMVAYARTKYADSNHDLRFAVVDALNLPLPDSIADLVIYPWSLNSIVSGTRREDWRSVLEAALAEGLRVVRPQGTIAVVETLNIANELPWGEVWHPGRRAFIEHLEIELGMRRELFSNDWCFRSLRNVRRYSGIWFERESFTGPDGRVVTKLPECAGIWWKRGDEAEPPRVAAPRQAAETRRFH